MKRFARLLLLSPIFLVGGVFYLFTLLMAALTRAAAERV